jgi:hypothetical protein
MRGKKFIALEHSSELKGRDAMNPTFVAQLGALRLPATRGTIDRRCVQLAVPVQNPR